MQKGGRWVQIACKIEYVLNGRPLGKIKTDLQMTDQSKNGVNQIPGRFTCRGLLEIGSNQLAQELAPYVGI